MTTIMMMFVMILLLFVFARTRNSRHSPACSQSARCDVYH